MVVGIVTAKIPGYNFNLALPVQTIRGFIESADNPVQTEILSNPTGSRVFINGRYMGETPVAVILYGSDVEVSLEHDGYQILKKTISPAQSVTGQFSFDLEPKVFAKVKVSVKTDPAGAHVWINNTDMGASPVTIDVDKNSKLRMRVKKLGYKEASVTESIGDTPEQNIIIHMEKLFGF